MQDVTEAAASATTNSNEVDLLKEVESGNKMTVETGTGGTKGNGGAKGKGGEGGARNLAGSASK
jgi:hypothetical protein